MGTESQTIRVYKYHKCNMHLIQMLALSKFYCATSKELNDPYDGVVKLTTKFMEDFFTKQIELGIEPVALFQEYYDSREIVYISRKDTSSFSCTEKINFINKSTYWHLKFVDLLLSKLDFRVVSFCGKVTPKQEPLMWGHYADSCKGVRLTFDFPLNDDFQLEDVIPIEDGYIPFIVNPKDIRKGLLSKYKQWEYENEKRILISGVQKGYVNLPNRKYLDFNPAHLTEIAFGANMSKEHMSILLRIINSIKEYNVKFFSQNIEMGEFEYEEWTKESISFTFGIPFI